MSGLVTRPHSLSPLFRGERVRVRGRCLLRRYWLPLTPTLSSWRSHAPHGRGAGRGRCTRALFGLIATFFPYVAAIASDTTPTFTVDERAAILSHGPWPQQTPPDPSNRVSGNPAAIALGRRLFFDTRLSSDQTRSCATCHDPARSFADGRDRSQGHERLDRNAIALANLRFNRWYGWSGAADSLWAQSLLRDRLATDVEISSAYRELFSARLADDTPERMLVNLAKALAAYQETIVTQRTAFDEFRDALERDDAAGMARYPAPAQRGLKIFVGKGRCTVCHFGPNFSNGEFDDVGVPYFAEPGRVDSGRHGGIAALRDNPFNLLGTYNDGADATHTRHVETQHRNWGEFRVPSLRNVARTAPYMHNGSLATLADVVRHYSEVDSERLHGDDGARIIRALRLTPQERADLVAFLDTLSSEVIWRKP
jgi:cytochrome c peroxidase